MNKELPLAGKCSSCNRMLDKESEHLVLNYREGVDYILTHGKCEDCAKEPEVEDTLPDLRETLKP